MSDRVYQVLASKGARVEVTHPRETILAAVAHMNQRRIGALLVTDGVRPLGILTERDILERVIAAGAAPDRTPVGEVMTRQLHTTGPRATIAEAMVLMTEHRCRHLPVVEGDDVLGLLSFGDLTGWMVRDQQRTIEDLHDFITHT